MGPIQRRCRGWGKTQKEVSESKTGAHLGCRLDSLITWPIILEWTRRVWFDLDTVSIQVLYVICWLDSGNRRMLGRAHASRRQELDAGVMQDTCIFSAKCDWAWGYVCCVISLGLVETFLRKFFLTSMIN